MTGGVKGQQVQVSNNPALEQLVGETVEPTLWSNVEKLTDHVISDVSGFAIFFGILVCAVIYIWKRKKT